MPLGRQMKNRVIRISVICFSCFLLLWGCEEFFRRKIGGFAGSYPFAESWELKGSEHETVEAIKELMEEGVLLQPLDQKESFPQRNSEYDWDSQEMIEYSKKAELDSLLPLPPKSKTNTKNEYWLHINFYYDDTDEVAHAWTRPDFDSTVTTIALVRLNQRMINRDYWFVANRREIHKFKTRIVDKIQDKINQRRRSST